MDRGGGASALAARCLTEFYALPVRDPAIRTVQKHVNAMGRGVDRTPVSFAGANLGHVIQSLRIQGR